MIRVVSLVAVAAALAVCGCGGGDGEPSIGGTDSSVGGGGIGSDAAGGTAGGSTDAGTTGGDGGSTGTDPGTDANAGDAMASGDSVGDNTQGDGTAGDDGAGPDEADTHGTASDGADPVEDGSDPVPDPPLTLSEEWTEGLCQVYCGDYGDNCGSFQGMGANYLGCIEECEAVATNNAWWISAYGCASATCSPQTCGVGADSPPEEDDTCAVACSAMDLCDQLAQFQLPEDEPDVCRVACTAGAMANPATAEGLECIIDALDPLCDQNALNDCYGGATPPATACPGYCAAHYDPQNPQFCSGDTLFRSVWPEMNDCIAACNEMEDGFDALTFVGCTQGSGCGDPNKCTEPPAEDPEGCIGSCQAFVDLCGALGPFSDPALCTAYCTGIVVNYNNEADPTAGACVSSLGTCPEDESTHGGLFYSCLLPKNETCTSLCTRYWTCVDPGVTAATIAQCSVSCGAGGIGSGEEVAAIEACMVDNEGDCAAVTACVPPGPGEVDPLCVVGCDKVAACSDAAAPDCLQECDAGLASGDSTVAELTCAITTSCEGIAACDGVGADPVQECVNACTVAPDVCGQWDDGCAQACAGILAGFGLEASDAFCAVGALGESCDFEAVGYACAGWDPPFEPVEWETDVLPLLQQKGCTGGYCHGGGASGLTMTSPESLITGGVNGPAVVPCDSESSLILEKLGETPPFGERMPLGQAPLTEEQMDVIRDWIDQGATAVYDAGACD